MTVCYKRLEIAKVLEARQFAEGDGRFVATEDLYVKPTRPASWERRDGGIDVIETSDGETVRLYSDGMQSVPKPGWTILTTGGDQESGYTWTLYGIRPSH